MPGLEYPDYLKRANPTKPIVMGDDVKGAPRKVTNITSLLNLVNEVDKLEENITQIFVESENKYYRLKNINLINDISSWDIVPYINDNDVEIISQDVFDDNIPQVKAELLDYQINGFVAKAVASTVPLNDLVKGSFYIAQPGVTYTNFLDISNNPIIVPIKDTNNKPILNAKLILFSTYWILEANGIDIDVRTVNGGITNQGSGSIDALKGPYVNKSSINTFIPSVIDSSTNKNKREGKLVDVFKKGIKETYQWQGGYRNTDLVKVNTTKNIYAKDGVLSKYRDCKLPTLEYWDWEDYSSHNATIPILGNRPIFGTIEDGWIDIPLTIDINANFLGIIFEVIVLNNIANFDKIDAVFNINNVLLGFQTISFEKVDNTFKFKGYYDLSAITNGDMVKLLLAIHSKNRPITNPIIAELSVVEVFYIDDVILDSKFTVEDVVKKTVTDIGTIANTVSNNTSNIAINSSNINIVKKTKVNKDIGNNKLDPNEFRFGYFYFLGQTSEIQYDPSNIYGVTDYIPVDVKGLITIGAGLTSQGLSSYVVFNSQKEWIRNGQNSNQYTYVSGDGFVVFVYLVEGNLSFPLTHGVNIGTTYLYEKFTDIKDIAELDKKIDLISNIDGIKNGKPLVYGDTINFTGSSITNRDIDNNILVYTKSGFGNNWIQNPNFIPTGSNLVHVKFDIEFIKINTVKGLDIIVSSAADISGIRNTLLTVTDNGSYDILFDPAYYNVYQGYSVFSIWINNQNLETSGSSLVVNIKNLQVFEYIDTVIATNISGDNIKDLFESTDLVLTNIKSSLETSDVYVSPSGNKYELSIQNNGTITSIPVIPSKSAFFGNSLIAGFNNYGMAASELSKDYYHRIVSYIQILNPLSTSIRRAAYNFETIENLSLVDNAIQTNFIDYLVGDEQLVSIQLGDNVNTTQSNIVFQTSALKLIKAIRTKCPNARLVWMGMWYGTTDKYNVIQKACIDGGCKFISLADLASDNNNKSAIGNLTKLGTDTRTLSNVTNIVANTSTNITITFTVGSDIYHTTINVNLYNLVSGTLTYNSEYEIITNPGIASHPGDEGFRKIANRFLFQMKLTDNIEYYN